MKPLFICNPSQVQAVRKHIEDNKIFKSVKSRDLDKCFITSQSECDNRRNDFIGKGDAPFTRLYIDPFLEWGKEEYYGYHIALDILTNWKKKEAPGLIFLSAVEQKGFDKLVKGKLNSFVREFIHFDFLELKEKCLPYTTFSTSRWKYLKAYALTSSGILDELSHDLTTIISQKESSRTSLVELITRIKNLSETTGLVVLQQCNEYDDNVNVSTFAKALQEKIEDRIKEIKPHEPSAIEVPANMNILIVEDNQEHLLVLEKALTERDGYFVKDKNLFSYKDGTQALNELKSSPNEFQLVLVDLKLNDANGFAQPVHGVDIIEELQKNHPLSSYTIITGMGRKGIGELLNIDVKFILSKKNLYSFDTESEVDKMLTKMIEDVARREKLVHYNFGPTGGIYNWTMFKSNLFALHNDILDDQKVKAFNLLEEFKSKTLNQELKVYSPKQKERYDINKIDEYHTNMLALRMIYLWLALKNKNKLTCNASEEVEYSEVLLENNISLSYGRAKDIGLSHTKSWTEDGLKKVEFDLKKLWGHEKTIVKEWEEKYEMEFLNYLEDIIISDNDVQLCDFLNSFFDYEEDWPWPKGVTRDIYVWNFKDLKIFLKTVLEDVIINKETSFHYPYVQSMCNQHVTGDYFHHHIKPELPKIYILYLEVDKVIKIE